MGKKLTHAQFTQKAVAVHGNRYKYTQEYRSSKHKLEIWCKKCRKYFEQSPNSHLSGFGCPTCGMEKHRASMRKYHSSEASLRQKTKDFIREAKAVHGTAYSYSKVVFKTTTSDVTIYCNACKKPFEQTPSSHLHGRGCPKCAGTKRWVNRKRTTEDFVKEARRIHGDSYDYCQAEYIKHNIKTTVWCLSCGRSFQTTPNNHLSGYGCPCCSKSRRYSKMAINWLTYMERILRIKIQHAENGGEVLIPGTKYKVDGFNKRFKMVFEFYGDCFHGNLQVFKPKDRPNPYLNMTTAQLHRKTLDRERKLKSLGYTVIAIWEQDWKSVKT